MTTQSLQSALEGVASVFEFARMSDTEKDRHLKDLEISNLQDEVKWYDKSIRYSRKKIAEDYYGSGVMTASNVYWLEQDELELNRKLASRAELKSKIRELRPRD